MKKDVPKGPWKRLQTGRSRGQQRAKAQGFLVSDYVERFSEGFIGMLQGSNLGKQRVQVSEWTA